MAVKRIQGWVALTIGLTVAGTGCATKKYVGGEVAAVHDQVSGVESQVEQAQVRLDDHDKKIASTSRTAQDALDRAVAAGKLAEGKFLYETVLTEDKVKFGFDRAQLSDEAQAALDEFAGQLKSQNKNVYIEIQGHTDAVGDDAYNEKLGQARADAARYYLAKHGIALHRMNSISYGEAAPVGDNGSQQGRAQNRRIVLVVLQ